MRRSAWHPFETLIVNRPRQHFRSQKRSEFTGNLVVSRHARRMVCLMIRFGTLLLLIGLGVGLCGCGSRYEALRAEAPQVQRVKHDVSPEPAVATQSVQPAALTDAGDITGSIARSKDIRPWPKRGTPEFDQLQAEELAREQRIKEVLGSICRGC